MHSLLAQFLKTPPIVTTSSDDSIESDNTKPESNETATANKTTEEETQKTNSTRISSPGTVCRGSGFVFDYILRLKENNAKLDQAQIVVDEEYVRPPEPIRINKMILDSLGIITIQANGDVDWPYSNLSLFNRTQELKSQNLANSEIRRLKLTKGGGTGIEEILKLLFEGATSMERQAINPENQIIEDLTGREIKIKIVYNFPELISFGDQNIQDRLVLALATPLVGKNGLEMSPEGF